MTDLLKRLPPLYTQGENGRLVEAIDQHRGQLERRVNEMQDLMDPDRCPAFMLDTHLRLLGWTADVELTERQKRKLIKIVAAIHRQSGTTKGMLNATRYILGQEPLRVIEYLKDRYKETGTVYPPEEDEMNYTFSLVFPMPFRLEDLSMIRDIIEYMKPPNTYYRPIIWKEIENTHTINHSVIMSMRKVFTPHIFQVNHNPRFNVKRKFSRRWYYNSMRLDGRWNLDGSQQLDGEVYETLTFDGSWNFDGTYDFDGFKENGHDDLVHYVNLFIQKRINNEIQIVNEITAAITKRFSHSVGDMTNQEMLFDGSWNFDGEYDFNGYKTEFIRHTNQASMTRRITNDYLAPLLLNGMWNLDGDQELDGVIQPGQRNNVVIFDIKRKVDNKNDKTATVTGEVKKRFDHQVGRPEDPLELDGTWNLNGNQELDGGISNIIHHKNKARMKKRVTNDNRSPIAFDGTWYFDGDTDFDGYRAFDDKVQTVTLTITDKIGQTQEVAL